MNFKESKSIYLQIADRLCDEILQGKYAEEERMPSVREYAALMRGNHQHCSALVRLSAIARGYLQQAWTGLFRSQRCQESDIVISSEGLYERRCLRVYPPAPHARYSHRTYRGTIQKS
jgi:DNA-binding transcriptional MocR family regulator